MRRHSIHTLIGAPNMCLSCRLTAHSHGVVNNYSVVYLNVDYRSFFMKYGVHRVQPVSCGNRYYKWEGSSLIVIIVCFLGT